MINILIIVGTATIVCSLILFIIILCAIIRSFCERLRWKYIYKHRFDKSPTAKCYCKDCKRYYSDDGSCSKFEGWKVADCWFCWDAEPKDKE